LQQFRRKRGQFCTLDDVLDVDGLGVKVLERLCDSILKEISGSEVETSVEMAQVKKKLKSSTNRRSQMLTPTLQFDQKKVRVLYNLQQQQNSINNISCFGYLQIMNGTYIHCKKTEWQKDVAFHFNNLYGHHLYIYFWFQNV
jgi:hypothetical protein